MATTERDLIIDDLKDRCKTVSGIKLVTRDWRKHATNDTRPVIYILDRTDAVEETDGRGSPVYGRAWNVMLMIEIAGTTGEKAPDELDAFTDLVRKAIYADQKTKIGSQSIVNEAGWGSIFYPQIGNNAIGRPVMLKIMYLDSVAALFQ